MLFGERLDSPDLDHWSLNQGEETGACSDNTTGDELTL